MDIGQQTGAAIGQQFTNQKNANYATAGRIGGCLAESAGANSASNKPVGFPFGEALARVKRGARMTRTGWNGRGQFIYIVEGSDPSQPSERASHLSSIPSHLFACGDQGTTRRLPHVALCNTRGESVPWLASMIDMLAEDWVHA